jgi:tRNA-dihydrouridine synthase
MNLGFWSKLKKPFLSLAPMEGVTDSVFRRSVARFGRPDVFYTEFTNVNGICSEGFEKVAQRLFFMPDEKPIVAQIWGIEPEMFLAASKKIAALGFDGIDINLGCPVRDVTKIGAGGRMIEKDNWTKVTEIIAATREGGGGLPVSVKTRIGYKKVLTEEWANFLLDQDLAEITFHLRTAAEMSKVLARWEEMEKIMRIKDEKKANTLICGNGDVKSRKHAKILCDQYGADGIMIGRGVFENPAVFSVNKSSLSISERLEALLAHAKLYEKQWGSDKPFVEMRKSIKMYVSGFSGAAEMRQLLMTATSAQDLEDKLDLNSG